ncbi:MAG: type II toxin-antitoxin system RelE/ParE family toxin [Bryobacterales bacterium]|nr:type II toxin-antitoxin system RelE/ParE family toxin [Bryobacterales bacterium]
MTRTVAYRGAKFTIAFAREKSGGCPACEFFDELSKTEAAKLTKAKLMALFQIAGDHGKFHNPEKFGDLGGGLFEFKSFQVRMPFAYAKNERGLILVTHAFTKKRDKTPKDEIERAWRIYREDQALTGLAIVKKAKR